jgi:hypothetical protein
MAKALKIVEDFCHPQKYYFYVKNKNTARFTVQNILMCIATCQFFCLLLQDKFRLDLSEEEAVQYMQNLIDVSATAIMAAMVERLHSLAQYWRK